jgi:hypothetical protein
MNQLVPYLAHLVFSCPGRRRRRERAAPLLRISAPTAKQRLSAIRHLLDWLVVGQIMPTNPASSVRGPSHVVKRGKTPVLSPEEARRVLDAIDVGKASRSAPATLSPDRLDALPLYRANLRRGAGDTGRTQGSHLFASA